MNDVTSSLSFLKDEKDYIKALPEQGMSQPEVLQKMKEYSSKGESVLQQRWVCSDTKHDPSFLKWVPVTPAHGFSLNILSPCNFCLFSFWTWLRFMSSNTVFRYLHWNSVPSPRILGWWRDERAEEKRNVGEVLFLDCISLLLPWCLTFTRIAFSIKLQKILTSSFQVGLLGNFQDYDLS